MNIAYRYLVVTGTLCLLSAQTWATAQKYQLTCEAKYSLTGATSGDGGQNCKVEGVGGPEWKHPEFEERDTSVQNILLLGSDTKLLNLDVTAYLTPEGTGKAARVTIYDKFTTPGFAKRQYLLANFSSESKLELALTLGEVKVKTPGEYCHYFAHLDLQCSVKKR